MWMCTLEKVCLSPSVCSLTRVRMRVVRGIACACAATKVYNAARLTTPHRSLVARRGQLLLADMLYSSLVALLFVTAVTAVEEGK